MQDIQFLSTLSLRRATGCVAGNWPRGIFLSTLSLRRATEPFPDSAECPHNFYPRSPCGERQHQREQKDETQQFLSTLSLRRATDERCKLRRDNRFLSTLSLRRATFYAKETPPHKTISIHALLAESDSRRKTTDMTQRHFYPRSPCGERRPASITPTASRNFYPRSPCGERRDFGASRPKNNQISIHALLAESDSSGR